MPVLFTFLMLAIIIVAHEFGHFTLAKLFGVRVNQFSLGFGKVLLKKKFGETEYRLSLLPLGGYVNLEGFQNAAVDHPEPERTFDSKPAWQRALILAAGPGFNVLLCVVALFFLYSVNGIPEYRTAVQSITESSPAQKAGLQPDDIIMEINGRPVKDWQNVVNTIGASEGKELAVTVRRGSGTLALRIRPETVDGRYRIGASAKPPVLARQRPDRAAVLAYRTTYNATTMTFRILGKMLTGEESAKKNLSGPVGIVSQGSAMVRESGLAGAIVLMASLSLALGIMNILPIPVLDGGHVAILVAETLRRKPFSARTRNTLNLVGFALLILLLVFATYNDILRINK